MRSSSSRPNGPNASGNAAITSLRAAYSSVVTSDLGDDDALWDGHDRPPAAPLFSLWCQKITRRDNLAADPASLRQHEFVVGHQRHVRRCAQRRKFSIIGVGDLRESGGIDRPRKLPLWPKKVGDLLPIEAWDAPQDHLGLGPGGLVPDQPEAPFADAFED